MAENVEVILRLRGSRQFVAQATSAATGVEKVGKESEKAGKKAEAASKKSGAFGKVLKGSFVLGATGAGALAVGLGKAFTAFEESRRVSAQTGAVLKSTGGAANVSGKQISDLATAVSNKTGMDDEAIQSGENLLLTFTKIRDETGKGNDIFSQTTGIMADMSAALGQDTKSSAMQLGKALNNPTKGVTALQRVGVAFTKKQKDQIASLQKHGDILGAQKIILRELNSEFKGSAQAQATPLAKMKVAWGNLMEDMGAAVAPFVDKGLTALTKGIDKVVPAVQKFIAQWKSGRGLGGQVADAFATVAGIVQNQLWPAVKNTYNAVSDLVNGFKQGKTWAVLLTATIAAFVAGLIVYRTVMFIISAATRTWAAIQAALNIIMALNPIVLVIAALIALGVAIVIAYKKIAWFRNAVNAVWAWLKQAAINVAQWFSAAFTKVKNALTGAYNWIKRKLTGLVDFVKGVPGKIASAASGMFNGIKDAFKAAVNWVIGKWNDLSFTIGGQKVFGKTLPSVTIDTPNIPLLQAGGTIARGGTAMVGERGPELVRLPPAAQVVPNSALAGAAAGGGQTIVTQVFLDRRQIAEAIGTYTADRIARR